VPLGCTYRGHYEEHVYAVPKSKDAQEVLKVMRNKLEDQVSCCPILSSISSKFLTLVA